MDDMVATLTHRPEDAVAARLRRIEGQACGLIRMHEEGRSAEQLLDQIASLRGALLGLGLLVAGREVASRVGCGQAGHRAPAREAEDIAALLHRLVHP